MTSLKPYLIRSIYEWIVDNNFTPYLLVNADEPGTRLPIQLVEDGKIVLNIRPAAIQGLVLGNADIEFNARFNGTPMHIVAPVSSVLAIYAKENGKGMVFDQDDADEEPSNSPKQVPSKPSLRVVK
jgi:stringent starvation protein B